MAKKDEMRAALLNEYDYPDLTALIEDYVFDSVVPGVCKKCCATVDEIEPDSQDGYCDECGTNNIVSAMVLAGVI